MSVLVWYMWIAFIDFVYCVSFIFVIFIKNKNSNILIYLGELNGFNLSKFLAVINTLFILFPIALKNIIIRNREFIDSIKFNSHRPSFIEQKL